MTSMVLDQLAMFIAGAMLYSFTNWFIGNTPERGVW